MGYIKESPVERTTKRSRVFPVYTPVTFVHPQSLPVALLRSVAHTYSRAVLGHLLFCHRVVPQRRDTCKVLPPHCVSQNWPATCGGRVNREQERPLARRYARACLRNSTAVTCGKYDTMHRSQKPEGSKGRVLPENCGASDRFLVPPRKQKTIVSGNMDDFTFARAKQSAVSTRPETFFKLEKAHSEMLGRLLCRRLRHRNPGIRD